MYTDNDGDVSLTRSNGFRIIGVVYGAGGERHQLSAESRFVIPRDNETFKTLVRSVNLVRVGAP